MTGNTRVFQPFDIGHPEYRCLVEPDTAFWALVRRDKVASALSDGRLAKAYAAKSKLFGEEMASLRFSQRPSAVYFNPTERCNLDCTYCYIPRTLRRAGSHMPEKRLFEALNLLKNHFARTLSRVEVPQIVFHGAEPLLNRDAVFSAIDRFRDDFRFGVQTNATLLDDAAAHFLKSRGVSIGLSLDAPTADIADRTRKNWNGDGVYSRVVAAMERLKGYSRWSVISTITTKNMRVLTGLVEFFHRMEAPACMLNVVRCTLGPARRVKPSDASAARHYLAALDRSRQLYEETGRKLPVANFANILLAILAPAARRLMCDISPCGAGRCFFALAPNGDLFPCSEFIGLKSFKGGNIFTDDIASVLAGRTFGRVTRRKVEDIEPCRRCVIRNFCGAPCPAETPTANGGTAARGAFCVFYREQTRYAFRAIANGREESYLWDDWQAGTRSSFQRPFV